MCVLCICVCSWLCICKQMPAFLCVWECTGVCVGQRSIPYVFFNCLLLIFGKRVSHWMLSSPIHLYMLAREHQGSACLCLSWCRGCLCSFCSPDVSWVPEIQTQIHMIAWRTLSPWNQPPTPTQIPVLICKIIPTNHSHDAELATWVLNLLPILPPHLPG